LSPIFRFMTRSGKCSMWNTPLKQVEDDLQISIYMEDFHGFSTDRGFSWIFYRSWIFMDFPHLSEWNRWCFVPGVPLSGLVHGTVRPVERKEWLRHQTHVVRQGYRVPDQGATHPGHP
jgi:hypothetical protein